MLSLRILVLLPCVAIVLVAGCNPPNEYEAPPPPEVTVALPVQQDVTLFIEENGRTEAVERAEVRARVQGFLEKIRFTEGSEVKEGDVLYVIEPREYRSARDAAKADLAVAEVAVTRARLEFERQDKLLQGNATSKSNWETAMAERDAAIAGRDKSKADLDRAELNFEYTDVKAPISGRITKTEVKRGNLVEDGTHLATIVKHDPIYATINISESFQLALQREGREKKDGPVDISVIPAELQRQGDKGFPFKGHLNYVDQEGIDQGTGTLMIRAVFPNPKQLILPGNYVRVRVPIGTQKDAVLIPERALGADQAGRYVLTVNSSDEVIRRNVKIGTKHGNLIVVNSGLSPDELVITNGIQRARDGSKVSPTKSKLSEETGELQETKHVDPPPAEDAAGGDDNGSGAGQ